VTAPRTGAYALLQAAHAFGARVCFANPGTTELALVSALDDVPGIRPVLGLFEGVCTGAADGHSRICGSPALTLLHLGPGLANGLANLHNARRAHSPIINIVGDHASWHLPYDAPLTSDIEMLAGPMSSTVIRVDAPEKIREAMRQAFERALAPPGSVATLIVPTDTMDAPAAELDSQADPVPRMPRKEVSHERIVEVARRLAHNRAVLLLGADALSDRGQRVASRIAGITGARLIMESYPAIVALGGDLPRLERLAYFPEDVKSQLDDDLVILTGARAPVSYFGYPGQPSELVAENRLALLTSPGEDSALALERLAEEVTRSTRATRSSAPIPDETRRDSSLTPGELARELVAQLPEGAIVSLEGSTCGAPYLKQAHRARRHWVMTNTGGAIGQGIPCGLGAAIGRPESRVICLQSDGSAQYTVQALWTIAREALDVTIIICANHRYGILQTELRRAGVSLDGQASAHMTRLDGPRVDWVSLGRGYGVPGVRVQTPEEFRDSLHASLHAPGPTLIECQLP
jgi:acetolactate synthase I/II/III large subunit